MYTLALQKQAMNVLFQEENISHIYVDFYKVLVKPNPSNMYT